MAVKMDTHIHTSFSTDSETDMQEQILTSYKKGLEGICITDHMDYNFPESALEHPVDGIPFCFDLDDYFKRIHTLQKTAPLSVYTGVECGMQLITDVVDKNKALCQDKEFDYIIGSLHLVDGKDPYYPSFWKNQEPAECIQTYFEKIYDNMEDIIQNAVKLVKGCGCKDGCAACVGDYRLDRQMVLFGLENLLEHWDVPMGVKTAEHAPSTFRRKEFSFEKLGEQWQEFCKKISENGENFAAFLQTVPAVEVRERMLILKLSSAFYADWVMEPGNRERLKNIISYYADVPVGFQIQVALTDEVKEPDKDAMEKMGRRLL